jgi:hypothetical protein
MAFSKARRLANLMSTASDSVPASKVNTTIADDAITTAKIADDAITTALIADDAVTADHLANSINSAITANTAKVTNAITTHTGDVTGGAALTIAVDAVDIPMLSATGSPSSATFLRGDNAWAAVPAGIDIQSSAPSVASEGSLYYNTTTDKLYLSNGTAWLPVVSNNLPTSTSGTVAITAINNNASFSYDMANDFADVETSDTDLIYSHSGGTLPPGMTMPNSGSSTLGGTATTAGSYSFSIKATDSSGGNVTKAYTQTVNVVIAASGGTITTAGGYKYHTFTSSGTFTVTGGAGQTIDSAIIAGGGAGGGSTGGGGGAGGFIESNGYTVAAQNYTITIGGGAGLGIAQQLSTSGSNTVALGQTAIGGGGGSTSTNTAYTQHAGLSGGSGGGGAHYQAFGAAGAGTSGQGNAGGTRPTGTAHSCGGGGKGAVGGSSNQYGNAGGVGLNWKSLGTFYAGGGGSESGAGGNGGGGAGNGNAYAISGTANTGGGGGAGWGYHSGNGGGGGSGIVIIRYVA